MTRARALTSASVALLLPVVTYLTPSGVVAAPAASRPGAVPAAAKPPVIKLLWSQEFNPVSSTQPASVSVPSFLQTTSSTGAASDYTWTAEVNNLGGGNYERQYYTDGPVSLRSDGTPAHYAIELNGQGQLAINAARTPAVFGSTPDTAANVNCSYGRCVFQSGRMNSLGHVGFKHGLLQARIKIPSGVGTWPAWWLMGANNPTVGWPKCGELDIMEAAMSSGWGYSVFGTMHSFPDNGFGVGQTIYPDHLYDRYHVYGLQWDSSKIIWSFDGKPFFTLTKTAATGSANAVNGVKRSWPFDQEMYMILNVAMGGRLGGDSSFNAPPDAKGGTMLVDWIRYSSVNGVGQVIRH